jgi:prepilin-type N-terminal cleavage/methylation domain-containing protein
MHARQISRPLKRAFSLIELLVVIAIITLLLGMLLPSLAGAREAARTVKCSSNQRQLITAWTLYASDFKDRAMPLAYWSTKDIGSGPQVFWWGTHGTTSTPPEYDKGFIAPYLSSKLYNGSVFECPTQPWGSYRPQGPSKTITSTYGYNGYYLSPAKTPGWAYSIEHRPWRRIAEIHQPTKLMVFADTLLPSTGTSLPTNNALLDPPLLFSRSGGGAWSINESPTTAFRHGRGMRSSSLGSTVTALADGHVEPIRADASWLTHPLQGVGSVDGATANGPRYVPDWTKWKWP